MPTSIRIIALAIGATILAFGAQAKPTTVDFESLSTGLPSTVDTQDVGGQISGFIFTGANAYGSKQTSSGGFSTPKGGNPKAVYVMSRKKKPDLSESPVFSRSISVALAGANAGEDIASLTFDSWVFSNTLQVYAFDATGAPGQVVGSALPGGGDMTPWGTRTIDLSGLTGKVNRIDFTASAESTLFALDNLLFTFSATGPGPSPVPEPGSYGLVALALAAAGMASRRRRA